MDDDEHTIAHNGARRAYNELLERVIYSHSRGFDDMASVHTGLMSAAEASS